MTTIYGIKNCDTVRKAIKWLESKGIEHNFHDFRVDGLTEKKVSEWMEKLGPEKLVNKRSTSWKQLSDVQKADLENGEGLGTLVDTPTLIKRPLLASGKTLHLGFKPDEYEKIFN